MMLCVPVDSMSRNKDKHEGASGRTYHIMSEAERASGRRGGWTTLEVKYSLYMVWYGGGEFEIVAPILRIVKAESYSCYTSSSSNLIILLGLLKSSEATSVLSGNRPVVGPAGALQ